MEGNKKQFRSRYASQQKLLEMRSQIHQLRQDTDRMHKETLLLKDKVRPSRNSRSVKTFSPLDRWKYSDPEVYDYNAKLYKQIKSRLAGVLSRNMDLRNNGYFHTIENTSNYNPLWLETSTLKPYYPYK